MAQLSIECDPTSLFGSDWLIQRGCLTKKTVIQPFKYVKTIVKPINS